MDKRKRDCAHAWWDKRIIRYFRHNFPTKEYKNLRSVYLALCEIDSDFNENPNIKNFLQTVCTYAGMHRETVGPVLLQLEEMGLIGRVQERVNGQFGNTRLELYIWDDEKNREPELPLAEKPASGFSGPFKNTKVSTNKNSKEGKKEEDSFSYNPPSLENNQEQSTTFPKQRVKDLPSKFNNQTILQIWNEAFESTPVRKINQITAARADKLTARRKEGLATERDWRRLVNKILRSNFLCGDNDRNWTITFDWIITNSTNWVKVMEGNYDNKKDKSPSQSNRFTPSGGIRCQDKSKYDRYMEGAEVINNDC